MSEDNKALALRSITEIWSQGNLDVIDELYDPSYVYHSPQLGEIRGGDGLKQVVTMWRTGYPDLVFTSEELIAEGDLVAQRWSCVGTHEHELMGIPATGKRTTATGVNIVRYKNGRAIEEWTNWDALGWLQQLGVVPPLG
jgi:steroid delta-isomerase-like uncharacterized protein